MYSLFTRFVQRQLTGRLGGLMTRSVSSSTAVPRLAQAAAPRNGSLYANFGKNLSSTAIFRTPAIAAPRMMSTSSALTVPSFGTSKQAWSFAGLFGFTGLFAAFQSASAADVPPQGLPGTRNERTFIAIKPDGVQRGIVADIIKRFEQKGYKLVALKMLTPTQEFAAEHYKDLSKKPFFPGLVKYFSSGPVVAMVWEGKGVIKGGRTLLGETNPQDSKPGSIRGDFCINVGRNICHGSDGPESANDEINHWFTPKELQNYTRDTDRWIDE